MMNSSASSKEDSYLIATPTSSNIKDDEKDERGNSGSNHDTAEEKGRGAHFGLNPYGESYHDYSSL